MEVSLELCEVHGHGTSCPCPAPVRCLPVLPPPPPEQEAGSVQGQVGLPLSHPATEATFPPQHPPWLRQAHRKPQQEKRSWQNWGRLCRAVKILGIARLSMDVHPSGK